MAAFVVQGKELPLVAEDGHLVIPDLHQLPALQLVVRAHTHPPGHLVQNIMAKTSHAQANLGSTKHLPIPASLDKRLKTDPEDGNQKLMFKLHSKVDPESAFKRDKSTKAKPMIQ